LTLAGGASIDYVSIGAVFAQKMPDELSLFMAGQVAAEESDHREAILRNVKEVDEVLARGRLRPTSAGEQQQVEPESGGIPGQGGSQREGRADERELEGASGRVGLEYFRRATNEAELRRVRPLNDDPLPRIVWDESGDSVPAGRAATYTTATDVVTASAKFEFFCDLKAWCVQEAKSRAFSTKGEEHLVALCDGLVKRWFEEALAQTVVALRSKRFHPEWGPAACETALSDEGLTAALVSHKWLLLSQIRRELGVRLGRLRDAVA
jgi:hypothetical protein